MIVTNETKAIAQQVVDFIIANPEKHSQESWFANTQCGTTMCIAGTVAMFELDVHSITEFKWRTNDSSIFHFAAIRLGLNGDEANYLFYNMDNDVAFNAINAIAQGDVDKFNHVLGIEV